MTPRCALLLLFVVGSCSRSSASEDASASPDAASMDARVDTGAAPPRLSGDARYDFDGDGHADLVVGDPTYRGGRGALWLIRAAAGGPREPMLIAEGEPFEHLGRFVFPVSDQDGDGRYEIGSYHSADQEVWSGRWIGTGGGRGTFPGLDRSRVIAIASADIDGDASPDIVASYRCGERCFGWSEVTREGAEEGVSWVRDPVVIEVPGTPRFGLVIVDEEGLLLRHGGTERRLLPAPLGRIGRIAHIGDFDGDHDGDLLVSTFTDMGGASVVLSIRADEIRTYETSCALGLGDRDCDGLDDVATWGPGSDGCSVWSSWLSAFGRPTHWHAGSADGLASEQPFPAESSRALQHPDLDLDGCRDEAGSAEWPPYDLTVAIWRGRRGETPVEKWPLTLPTSVGRARVLLNIDDVVWARSPYVVPPAFRHVGAAMVGVEGMPGEASTFGDVDGDGISDAFEILEGDTIFWRGRGDRFERTEIGVGGWSGSLILGDVDGDGDDEVLLREFAGPRILRGGSAFPDEGFLVTLVAPEAGLAIQSLGDLDGDGRVDLGGLGTRVHVWLGRNLALGDGVPHASFERVGWEASPGDVDGDGFDDLVHVVTGWDGSTTERVRVHRGRPGLEPDPEPWDLGFDVSMGPVGPDGLILPLEREGTTVSLHRATRDGLVEHATITAPVSVREAHFQGRLLVLPWADEAGIHVYRVRDGALDGPTLITLPSGEPSDRPLSFSPRLWTP